MDVSWKRLSSLVDERLLKIIKDKLKFKKMTLVQAAAIPQMVNMKDVVVQAATGSGKTISFLLPLINYLIKHANQCQEEIDSTEGDDEIDEANLHKKYKNQIKAIILSPTRELAQQTLQVLKKFLPFDVNGKRTIDCVAFIGGPNPCIDIAKFETHGGQIVVATPGRLLEVMERCAAITTSIRKNLEILILDEVDQLLSSGFERYVNPILAKLPKLRRTWIFSATQAKYVEDLVRLGLRDPVRIDVKEKRPMNEDDGESGSAKKMKGNETDSKTNAPAFELPSRLKNYYLQLDKCEDKLPMLINLITNKATANYYKKIIVFATSCVQVNYYALILKHFTTKSLHNYPIMKIHRKLKKKRNNLFTQFKSLDRGLLISTDLMARGVDIPKVDLVINCDLPTSLETFVHRSGRSGHQVNEIGTSVVFLMPNEQQFVPFLQKKGIQIDPFPSIIERTYDNERTLAWIRKQAVKDEFFFKLGLQSFVAFIRSYSSKWNGVFFEKLDPIDLVNGFGLLRVPTMPELKQKVSKSKTELRVSQQEKAVAKQRKQEAADAKKESGQDTKSKDRPGRLKRKPPKKVPKGMKRWQVIEQEDIEEINRDAQLLKKRKKKQISEKAFEEEFLTK